MDEVGGEEISGAIDGSIEDWLALEFGKVDL